MLAATEMEAAMQTKPLPATASVHRSPNITADVVAARWREIGAPAAVREQLLDSAAARDMEQFRGHIENFIGTVKIPVGIAGPLHVRGTHAQGHYLVPLATTEAALVASYSRGARLISEVGGCRALVLEEAICRSPAFAFQTLDQAVAFAGWLRTQQEVLQGVASTTSRYARLIEIRSLIEGNHVYTDFEFVTGDAAGQNMVTFATEAMLRHIGHNAPVAPSQCFIEVNHSGDKKASARALQRVRGRRVSAEVELPAGVVRRNLHTTAACMSEYWRIGAIGSALSGTIGLQGHYANALTALLLACGQDPACVAESAIGVTRMELTASDSLYVAVTLPSLVVGTVGGATCLPSQQACLSILGLAGPGNARTLAEICAALCLAGEISLVGAICAGEFAKAHRELARDLRRLEPADAT